MTKFSFGAGQEKKTGLPDDGNLSIFKIFFETAPLYFWLKDRQNHIVKISKTAAELHGRQVEEIEGKLLTSFLPEDLCKQLLEEDKKIISSKGNDLPTVHAG